jgi:hypothetical protein
MGHGDSHALSEGAYADTDGIALSHFGRGRRDVKRLRGARPNARKRFGQGTGPRDRGVSRARFLHGNSTSAV